MKKNVKLLRILCILLISCNMHASSISSRNLPTQHLQYKIISFFVDLFSTHNSVHSINDKSSKDIVNFSKLTSIKSTAAFSAATGDYQSNGNGDWTTLSSWQTWNGSAWVAATEYPGDIISGSYTVTIKTGDTITISSDLSTQNMGDVIVYGTLILGDNTSNQHTTTLSTQQLTIATTTPETGTITFYGPKIRLNLPNNAALIIEPLSTIDGSCTNNDEIFIGSNKYATCVGGGSTTYSFGELVADGGSINAEITTPPSNSTIEACSLVFLEGTYTGSTTGFINHQWSLLDPNGITTPLTTTVSGNISSSSFTPTITGDYLVSFEVSDDDYTNVETRTITVTPDTTAPVFDSPPAATSVQCIGDVPAMTNLGWTDNCDGSATVVGTDSPFSGCEGIITRTWNYTDIAGNPASASQLITIDYAGALTPPALGTSTVACPADATDPGAPADITDACGRTVAAVLVGQDAATPACEGTVVWRYRYTACDNSTTVDWTHTYTIDLPSPIVPANGSSTVQCLTDAVQVAAPVVTDACGNNLTAVITENTDPVPACGANKIYTYTYTDCTNNVSVYTFTYTVDDTIAPTVTAPTATALQCAGDIPAAVTTISAFNALTGASASDNCTATASLTVTSSTGILVGQSYSGTITRTYTITDACGNPKNVNHVFNINDTTPPTAVCKPITVQLVNGSVNIDVLDIDNGSYDNCGTPTLVSVSPSSFTCSDVGANSVTLTVKDAAGNQNTCTTTVTVEDKQLPTVICKDIEVTIPPGSNTVSITAADIDNGSSDYCGIASMSVSPDTFTCGNLNGNAVTLTVTDVNGNVNTCTANVVVNAQTLSTGTLTGEVVNPQPTPVVPASSLIEVTACPGGIADPKDVLFNLTGAAASEVVEWQITMDEGVTWTTLVNSQNQLSYTITNLLSTAFVRVLIDSGSCYQYSPVAHIRFLPPDEPPVIISTTALDICLTQSVTVVAESYYDYASQFGEGGFFNYAQPEDWRVNYVDGDFPAAGDNGRELDWKETNSNNNALFSNINYDTDDNTKFALAHGVGNQTQLETPIFSTIGMTASDAILNFYTSFYFCNGGYGTIWLSFDGGNTYTQALTTIENLDFTSGNTTGVHVTKSGNCNSANSQRASTNPRMVPASIDLGQYIGLSGLRIRFEFFGSTSTCNNVSFPAAPGNNCSPVKTFDVASGWAIDNVGFPYAPIDEVLEWTDEDGNVVAQGSTVDVTPVTPGIRKYGVTALVNGCRADTDAGTEFVNINTSLAYAGQDFIPDTDKCGASTIQLNAYDNTLTSVENYNNGAWEASGQGYYVVPDILAGDTNYLGTGVGGTWSVVTAPSSACGSSATFSSNTDPRAIFTGEPGTYVLRWTLNDATACSDDVEITITSCNNLDFDGVDDYVTFKNNYNLNGPFSIEAWIKPNATSGTIFSRKDNAVNTVGYDLSLSGGSLVFNFGSGSISTGNIINTTRWFHVAVTFNGSTYKLYVDGVEKASTGGSAPTTTPNNIEAILGAMDQAPPGQPVNHYSGWIDEFRVWNRALNVQHIRQMMNQEILDLGGNVGGEVIPIKIYGPDTNQDGTEEDLLTWAYLDGYYRMAVDCGYLTAYKGVSGRLRNINTNQTESAPIPYTTVQNGNWNNSNTWTYGNVWYIPNSTVHNDKIDWNIVKISNDVTSDAQDITVLGLLVDSGKLTITNSGTQDETNVGHGLWVTHYLKLDGFMDLVGESQLVQKRYNTFGNPTVQFNESVLEPTSSGLLKRDQQGTVNIFNYNYWSFPVGERNPTSNNVPSVINWRHRDGTDSNNFKVINWLASGRDASPTSPISIPEYWLYSYENYTSNTYGKWVKLNRYSAIKAGLGYTMKGSGATGSYQNYSFIGKPNNDIIKTAITAGNDALVGNPYPSAIDAREFIKDNIPTKNPDGSTSSANPGTTGSIDGSLNFWIHYTTNNTHVLRDYQGGYATYNLAGGVAPVSSPLTTTDGFEISGQGSSNLRPGDFIPVAQGFFVHSAVQNKLSDELKFQNSQRVFKTEADPDDSQFLKSSASKTAKSSSNPTIDETAIKRVRLQFKTPEGARRHLLLAFTSDNEATDGFDYGYDAKSFDNLPNDMLFMINDEKYVIQAVGAFNETKQYPLGIFSKTGGAIEISVTELENLDPNTKVYIYDSLLGTYTKINEKNSKYETTLDVGNYLNRFFITFVKNNSLSVADEILEHVQVNYLQNSGEIYIKTTNGVDVKQVNLVNILGQNIKAWNPTNTASFSNDMKIPIGHVSEGSYIINVLTTNGSVNKKVVINQ